MDLPAPQPAAWCTLPAAHLSGRDIKDPRTKIPGTKMVFAGIKNEKEIADLTVFLRPFGKDGKKL